ncbi:MAG: agmatine deiminase family protein, partial [Nanoarchaeota archaeon]
YLPVIIGIAAAIIFIIVLQSLGIRITGKAAVSLNQADCESYGAKWVEKRGDIMVCEGDDSSCSEALTERECSSYGCSWNIIPGEGHCNFDGEVNCPSILLPGHCDPFEKCEWVEINEEPMGLCEGTYIDDDFMHDCTELTNEEKCREFGGCTWNVYTYAGPTGECRVKSSNGQGGGSGGSGGSSGGSNGGEGQDGNNGKEPDELGEKDTCGPDLCKSYGYFGGHLIDSGEDCEEDEISLNDYLAGNNLNVPNFGKDKVCCCKREFDERESCKGMGYTCFFNEMGESVGCKEETGEKCIAVRTSDKTYVLDKDGVMCGNCLTEEELEKCPVQCMGYDKSKEGVQCPDNLEEYPAGSKWCYYQDVKFPLCCAAKNSKKPEICDNGIDDNGDDWIDCADEQCMYTQACNECKPKIECEDINDCKNKIQKCVLPDGTSQDNEVITGMDIIIVVPKNEPDLYKKITTVCDWVEESCQKKGYENYKQRIKKCHEKEEVCRWGEVCIVLKSGVGEGEAKKARCCPEDYEKYRDFIDKLKKDFMFQKEKSDLNPEYEQSLDNILLSMDKNSKYKFATQAGILKNVPSYTQIKILVPSGDLDYIKGKLKKEIPIDVYNRINFIETGKGTSFGIWMQDPGVANKGVYVASMSYIRGGQVQGVFAHQLDNNKELDLLRKYGVNVIRPPALFGGGNVFIARDKKGNKVVLIGGNAYKATINTYNRGCMDISKSQFKEYLKKAFNADKVIILEKPNGEKQDDKIFHLDQSMVPLGDGKIAMVSVKPDKLDKSEMQIIVERRQELKKLTEKYGIEYDEQRGKFLNLGKWVKRASDEQKKEFDKAEMEIGGKYQLQLEKIEEYSGSLKIKREIDAYRAILTENDFDIVGLKADSHSSSNFEAYTNVISYTDKTTGEKTIIMPIFPNEGGKYKMEGLNLKNKEAYESAGYKVKVVQDTGVGHGNIHCLTTLVKEDSGQKLNSCVI